MLPFPIEKGNPRTHVRGIYLTYNIYICPKPALTHDTRFIHPLPLCSHVSDYLGYLLALCSFSVLLCSLSILLCSLSALSRSSGKFSGQILSQIFYTYIGLAYIYITPSIYIRPSLSVCLLKLFNFFDLTVASLYR